MLMSNSSEPKAVTLYITFGFHAACRLKCGTFSTSGPSLCVKCVYPKIVWVGGRGAVGRGDAFLHTKGRKVQDLHTGMSDTEFREVQDSMKALGKGYMSSFPSFFTDILLV